jgi:hypothetical protein
MHALRHPLRVLFCASTVSRDEILQTARCQGWGTDGPPGSIKDHAGRPGNERGQSIVCSKNWAMHQISSYVDLMNRLLLPLASLVAIGCAETAVQQSPAMPPAPPVYMVFAGQTAQQPGVIVANSPTAQQAYRQRDVGDFIVYRFSGRLQKTPSTLTKRIIGRSDEALELDVILEQGRKKERYRVRLGATPTNWDQVISAARIDGDRLVLISVEKFKNLMARTIFMADENEQLLQSEPVVATVGQEPLAAQRNTYRVRIGKKRAILRATSSPEFCWGDIEGEILNAKGDVLYRSEIVHLGHRNIKIIDRTSQVAQSNYDFE